MKNIDYDDILSQLSRRRQDNLRIQDRRKAELYEKLPRVKEIDDELSVATTCISPIAVSAES